MHPKRRLMALACAALSSVLAAAILTGCKTHQSTSFTGLPGGQHEKIDLAALYPGAVVITSGSDAAEVVADPPNRQVEPMSEGAADATRSFLDTPHLGNPQLEAGVGAVQFALSPFAAAYGAIRASQRRLSPDEMSEAQQALALTMRSSAGPESLVQKVGEIARQKTLRLLVCAAGGTNASPNLAPVSAVLEICVKNFRLKVDKPGGNQYALQIVASARLMRAADGRILLERSYHYESGPGLFVDWTRHGGLEEVAQTGYQVLASQIAEDVFDPVSQAPILIGPGKEQPGISSRRLGIPMAMRIPVSEWSPQDGSGQAERWEIENTAPGFLRVSTVGQGMSYPAGDSHSVFIARLHKKSSKQSATRLRFVSLLQEEATGSMEIHTGKTDERLRSPKPGLESGSSSGGESDTKWALDGLEDDRNAVVQGLSCLAAVPFGLWEQTVGLVSKRSRERMEEYSKTLNAVTTQQHFEGDLADEVAQRLKSNVVDPVRRMEEPMRFAFTSMEQGGLAASNAPVQCKTALEIQVLSTKLVGKHRNSASRAMVVEIQATVFRTSDGQEIYSRPIRYQSSEKRLKDWAASDARLFRRELESCSQRTAQALVNDLMSRGLVTPLRGAPTVN